MSKKLLLSIVKEKEGALQEGSDVNMVDETIDPEETIYKEKEKKKKREKDTGGHTHCKGCHHTITGEEDISVKWRENACSASEDCKYI